MGKDYLAIAQRTSDDAEHHGVKGMKWGVRKADSASPRAEKKAAKAVKKANRKFENSFRGVGGFIKVNNAIADEVNPRVEKLNNTPKYKDKNLYQDKKLHEEYWNDIDKLFDESYAAASKTISTNTKGNTKATISRTGFGENSSWRVDIEEVKHAAVSDQTFQIIRPVVDENGQMIDLEFVKPSDLEHHGIKGMKWGIRRNRQQIDSAAKAPKKHDGPESHGQKYERLRAEIKKNGPNALSTEDLNFVNARADALNRVAKLESNKNWLADTSKQVLQETGKKLMKDLTQQAVKQFIVKPLMK